MYHVIAKDTIMNEMVPNLPTGKRGFKPGAPLCEIVNAILFKLKTGIQWKLLPVKSLFTGRVLCWNTVYHHYRKWCKMNAWEACWISLLSRHKKTLDLSSADLDGSHSTALKGGEQVSYQGRKKRKTTNSLYLSDRQGIPIALSSPTAGAHNDLYQIEVKFEEIIRTVTSAGISIDGLFINADAGFDSNELRRVCGAKGMQANICFNKRNRQSEREEYFDAVLYKERYSIERTNAWMDSYRSVLNRFDTTVSSWLGFNYLAFMAIFFKKIRKLKV